MKIFDKKIQIIILIILIAIVAIYFFTKDNNYEIYSNNEFIQNNNQETQEIETIFVHVTGEVNSPGMVSLSNNSRISDAIEKAGGVTALADISKVNLAYILR